VDEAGPAGLAGGDGRSLSRSWSRGGGISRGLPGREIFTLRGVCQARKIARPDEYLIRSASMSKQIETQIEPGSRSDLPFFDRQPTTSIVSFRVEQSETGCPTVGSEIEISGFHLFAVSTASPASIEVREPITPQSVGQRAGEYPVIATTKKTLCLGKTFPLMTVGTDNPVLGPQVLSEVQAIKKMRAMGIPME